MNEVLDYTSGKPIYFNTH